MRKRIWNFLQMTVLVTIVSTSGSILVLAQSGTDGASALQGDFFSIKGEVEFEGQRIVYDEIIETRTKLATSSDMGQVRGNNKTLVSRLWITRPLKDGSALVMEVPNAFGLWTDLKGHGELDPTAWPPERIAKEQRPPETILPEFYWINDLKTPTAIEAYLSESYFEQPSARLKIIDPIRLNFVAPSSVAEERAIAQMNAEPSFDVGKGRPTGSYNWMGIVLFPMEKKDWSQVPEIGASIEAAKGPGISVLSRKASDPALQYGVHKLHWGDAASDRFGVAQPKRYPDGEGMIGRQWLGYYSDAAIPTDCNTDLKVCTALMDRHGYYVLYDSLHVNRGVTLNILNMQVKVKTGDTVYLPSTQTVYFVYTRQIW